MPQASLDWTSRFLCASLAIGTGFSLALFGVHFALIGHPQTEPLQWKLFGIGWLTIPPFCIGGIAWVERKTRWFDSPSFLNRVVFFQLLPLCFVIPWLRSGMGTPTWAGCGLALMLYGAGVYVPLRFSAVVPPLSYLPILWGVILVECVVGKFYPLPSNYLSLGPIHFDYRALALAAVCTWLVGRVSAVKLTSPRLVPLLAGLLLAAFLLARQKLPIELQHQNFYLGPANDVMHGKTLLVDSVCQYGVAVIYFLAALFSATLQPPSYAGLTVILGMLLCLEYLALFEILRRALRSILWACLSLMAVLSVNYFAGYSGLLYFPAAGPLRFGLPIAILFFLSLGRERSAYAVLGVSSIWSLETFIYSLGAIAGWYVLGSGFLARLKEAAKQSALACLCAHLLLIIFTYLRSGRFPHWEYYLPYVTAYTPVGGVGIETGFHWDEWVLVSLIYFASLVSCLYFWTRSLALICGFTFLGIAQFTYYLGQTHPSYLTRCCIPAVVLVFLWFEKLVRAQRFTGVGFTRNLHFVGFTLLFLLFFQVRHRVWNSFAQGNLFAQWGCVHSACPTNERTRILSSLIQKHATHPDRIGLFLSKENETVEALLLTRRAHEWPMSEPRQDFLVPIGIQRVMSHQASLKPGDVFFSDQEVWNESLKAPVALRFTPSPVGYDSQQVLEVQAGIVRALCMGFRCHIEENRSGFLAVRLSL